MYRQGDVYLIPIAALPPGLSAVPRDPRHGTVLAYGEATGHAHALVSERTRLFRLDDGAGGGIGGLDRYLTIRGPGPAALTHDEHRRIDLPPGHYRVIRQREYSPGAVPRYVAD